MPGRHFAPGAHAEAPTFANTAPAPMLRFALATSLLALAACATVGDLALPPTAPVAPRTMADSLVAEALRYGFERPGDVPNRQFLVNPRHVPIQVEVWRPENVQPSDTLTANALPAGGRTRFSILSMAEIKALARARGEFSFATTGQPDVTGDTAYVHIGIRNIAAVNPDRSIRGDGFGYSGAGYLLQFVRRDGRWEAVGPVSYISS